MIGDIWTVAWKEWKHLFAQGGRRGGLLSMLVFVGVFGVFLPLQTGRDWVASPLGLVYWAWVPLFLVIGLIADAFAGERERHTLETLLASRLSDKAILFGKVVAAMGYGWGMALAGLILSLITVNVAYAGGGLLLYSPEVAVAAVVLSLLTAGLAAGAGVLVSLRAATVRQATQTMSIATMLLLFVPVFGIQALPQDVQLRLVQTVMGVGTGSIWLLILGASAVLIVIDAALLAASVARFKRAQLILD
ncbi:MAG: ABC transporter permease [Dehalococcoidales bacterium]|nr:ABC transporter permease [Dehalococcoidales bacterium]